MTDMRAEARQAFLAAGDWSRAHAAPLSGDASFRRYFRLNGGPAPALLMDAPPPLEDVAPFVQIAEHLGRMGFSAPVIHDQDMDQGFLIIEDFGEATYTRRLAAGASEKALYELATDTLIALHENPDATAIDLPTYDAVMLEKEADILIDWFLPTVTGVPTSLETAKEYRAIWRALYPLADHQPATLVLRDYHVDNLMELPGREGVRACGLLDFQDALVGSPAYDMVSLVADARRDVSPNIRAAMVDAYCAAFPDLDRTAFEAASAMLSAQRHCKIIGIFTRLMVRDSKPVYLKHVPRVWRLLEADLEHPALSSMKQWMNAAIPARYRRSPDVTGLA